MTLSLLKLPNKGLVIAHVNICSIRNKIHDLNNLVLVNSIHILAVSETHLDSFIQNSELAVVCTVLTTQGFLNCFHNIFIEIVNS